MQQTNKRYFNLIETSDKFSPDALNDNAQKLEAALDGLEAYADAGDAALDVRVVELEKFRFAVGVYIGDDSDGRVISLPFNPVMVAVTCSRGETTLVHRANPTTTGVFVLTDDGFLLRSNSGLNIKQYYYTYAAFGIDG